MKKTNRLLWLLLASFFPLLTMAVSAGELPVKVEKGWVRAVPSMSTATAAYMTFINSGDKPVRVTGGSTEIAEMVMPMAGTRHTVDGRPVVGMKDVDALVIPKHGRLVLEAGGDHLMLMGLKKHPKPGERVKIKLQFDGEELSLELPVALTQP